MHEAAPSGGLRKVKRTQYVQITNETVRDTRISYRALGILTELLSHEEGWVVRTKDLGRRRKEGTEAIGAALRELAAAGYYRVERRRGPSGKFAMGTAVADYPIPAWAQDFQRHPRGGVPVRVDENGDVLPDHDQHPEPDPGNPDRVEPDLTGSGFPGPGDPGPGFPVPLEDPSQKTITEGSAALRAATAGHGQTSSSNVTSRNASPVAAAAKESDQDHGDAARAGRTHRPSSPDSILEAMMLNEGEGSRFRSWLVQATGATNPDGLIVTLYAGGQLSERISQWRAAESGPGSVPGPVVRRDALRWCGQCDQDTRLTVSVDDSGNEYVLRCPACNINAGATSAGSGAAQEIAAMAARTNRTPGHGRKAFLAARAALPAGTTRRTTTIGTVLPVGDESLAEGAR